MVGVQWRAQPFLLPLHNALEVALAAAFFAFAVRVGLVGLIAERNTVLARNIRRACVPVGGRGDGEAVVAILGLAHLNGVRRLLAEPGEVLESGGS